MTTKTKLNEDIQQFPQVSEVTNDMNMTFEGVSRLIMLDRYSFKDTQKKTLGVGDLVILTVKPDPHFPARGVGEVTALGNGNASVRLEEAYAGLAGSDIIEVPVATVDKPLEIYYEQITERVARGLAEVESTEKQAEVRAEFYEELSNLNFVPAGRVLYGAGSGAEVTYFNCYVMPYIKDSREGIGEHRNEVMEIMSRGGGVGTNGSTLRPRNALARGVNGKSSGSVSWLDDIAKLTHLVEQGGSRRGAQMIILQSSHPDILQFIISKMQNPRILRFIIETTEDDEIKQLAKDKLKFTPLSASDEINLKSAVKQYEQAEDMLGADHMKPEAKKAYEEAQQKLEDGGTYAVHDPEFLSGANISVGLTHDFMEAVENNDDYELRFPDVENYDADQMAYYNENWHEVGDVREWPLPVKTYRTVKAQQLWDLINICATYAAEPGIFFIDNANDMTNAQAYGQKVVATNPCGEQPLAPYSVCNLAAVNLAEMVTDGEVDYEKLKRTVRIGTRMQDNVIDATPYFLEANEKQALGERRVGLGVMGLADLLIKCGVTYGSEEGNLVVDKIFETIALTSYRTSIELAKEKGSFPFMLDEDGSLDEQVNYDFIHSGYMMSLPMDIRKDVLKHGIRNSHLLTVAPTGSTGSMIGVSTGLEPYFAFKYYRSGRLGKFIEVNADIVEEQGADPNNLPDHFVTAMGLSPEAHADTQNVIQRWIDSSISKTVNAPKGYAVDQVQAVYERLYEGGAKGGTVYVDGSRDAQVLSLTADENGRNETEEEPEPKVFEESVKELGSTSVNIGTDIGDTCPNCRQGTVEDIGGCATCTNCGVQLKCGL